MRRVTGAGDMLKRGNVKRGLRVRRCAHRARLLSSHRRVRRARSCDLDGVTNVVLQLCRVSRELIGRTGLVRQTVASIGSRQTSLNGGHAHAHIGTTLAGLAIILRYRPQRCRKERAEQN